MHRLLIAVAVLVVLVVIVQMLRNSVAATSPLVSGLDGVAYRVHTRLTAPQTAADTLAALNGRATELLRVLRRRYGGKQGARAQATRKLLARYDPDGLAESSPLASGQTAYTVNKGELLAVCLRERDPTLSGDPAVHDFHRLDLLTFVVLHELAHIAVEELGHTARFWSTFRWLIEEAEKAGITGASPNFEAHPRDYCGLTVDYNPRYDPRVVPI
jgi:hypothetical protein